MSETVPPRITILGLGIMGSAIARRALSMGLRVTGWDRTPARAQTLATNGLEVAENPRTAAANADVVVTMVADADAVMNVMDDLGAFKAMTPRSTWVQMATIGLEGIISAIRLAGTRSDVAFVDAPVSGSKIPAQEGKLIVLASGDRSRAGEPVERFFSAIASKVWWLGEEGQGTRMKILMNAWIGILMEGIAEVAILARVIGIDPQRFHEIVSGGPLAAPWALGKLAKIFQKRTQETEFPLRWATKDVRLALEAAGEASAALPVLRQILTTWDAAVEEGFGGDDLSAVYVALSRQVEHYGSDAKQESI
ncbi:MAG: NAD(P)-dependent oxidoreductase [Vulcanimicrobiaceae bacterium]